MGEEKKIEKHARPGWDEYFIGISDSVATRCTCDRGPGGCVIVRDKQILTTGYIGSPVGLPHCSDVGHEFKETIHEDGHKSKHCVRTIHSEMNAICQAAKLGISLNDATLYNNKTPCRTCAMAIINAGIKRVVCKQRYHADEDTIKLFADAGIKFEVLSNTVAKYPDQK